MAYLLNPAEDHGLSNIFLVKFLKKLELDYKYKELSRVDIKTEQLTSRSKRLDLRLLFSDPDNEDKPDFEIIIENKVNDYVPLCNDLEHYLSDSETIDTFLVLLTPPNWKESGIEKFTSLKTTNKRHIKWGYRDDSYITITDVITEILKEESLGDLSPLSNEIIHYLKSLKDFILNYMSLDQKSKQSIDLGKILQEKEVNIKGRRYLLSMHENSSIKVFDVDAQEEVVAKPVLREVIKIYVPLEEQSKMLDDPARGKQINTRTMGKRLLEWMEKNI